MKYLLNYVVSVIICMSPYFLQGQDKGHYEITGVIKGLTDGQRVWMDLVSADDRDFNFIRKDTAVVKNGRFYLKGIVPDGPRIYWLKFEGLAQYAHLFIDNGQKITITYDNDITTIPHQAIERFLQYDGCPTEDAAIFGGDLARETSSLMVVLDKRLNKIVDSVGFDPVLIGQLADIKASAFNIYYRLNLEHPEPDFNEGALLLAVDDMVRHASFLPAIYSNLPERLKNCAYGKYLKQVAPLCVGQIFPSFSLPDAAGKQVLEKDVISKSQLTIVHFWAINSVGRKRYDDNLLAMYHKYHDKGLDVIGISSENNQYGYKKFLAEQNFPWQNLDDFMGNDGIVAKTYKEYGDENTHNTTNVLIDANGKIIAWDPTDIELQWYLWKYLEEGKSKKDLGSNTSN
jgi:peroxiredoxin